METLSYDAAQDFVTWAAQTIPQARARVAYRYGMDGYAVVLTWPGQDIVLDTVYSARIFRKNFAAGLLSWEWHSKTFVA